MRLLSSKIIKRFKYNNIPCRNKSYSHTVILPKTNFPLKLQKQKLTERDENINKIVSCEKFYQWQRENLSEPELILHDGPPYANGPPHMGHAINKILKDTILRYHILNGKKVHYVPGWDCHGLPIELKACSNSENMSAVEIRSKAKNFATKTIENQMAAFKSWGITGDWKNAYKTYSDPYVKNQLKQFYMLYKNGYIYRDFKPVYWSPSSRTALAEAELEYKDDHISPSVYVRLRIMDIQMESLKDKIVYAVIWTTTPWTLPSNQAVCFNPDFMYCFVRKPAEKIIYIVAAELVESLSKEFKVNLEILGIFKGDLLDGATYYHPVYKEKIMPFLSAAHVTATKGTGLVHTAPAHGPEDFLVALDRKIQITDLVDEKGCYKEVTGEQLSGKFVFTEGNTAVLNLIQEDLVHLDKLKHSYPYDWRTKEPVIIRASQQWFIDTNRLKQKAVELLHEVQIVPKLNSEIYKRNLINQLEKRPYWCISRQRKWGVPIPVLFNTEDDTVIINEETMKHYDNLLDRFGTDFWWRLSVDELVPESMRSPYKGRLSKSQDIMDIWFDSGISWSYVLGDEIIADVYLEGVDQFTGWFQSSLLSSVALREKAPYKTIYVHGFAVDENGVKMSKSLGNVVDPVSLMKGNAKQKPYGVDVLRWWVACHASQDSVASVSDNVLESCAAEVQKIRSVLRFALGALADFTPSDMQYSDLLLIDKYMLHLLVSFYKETEEALKGYQFNKIRSTVLNFVTNPVSALYYTAIKDRLYCEPIDSHSREAAQFVLSKLFRIIVQSIAPIVPHLAEELFMYLPQKTGETFFKSPRMQPDFGWMNKNVENLMEVLLNVRKDVNKKAGAETANSAVTLSFSSRFQDKMKDIIPAKELKTELIDILQVAEVDILVDESLDSSDYSIAISKSVKHLCDRCRRVQAEIEGCLCNRCTEVVKIVENKKASVS